jgi:hypothetical protein
MTDNISKNDWKGASGSKMQQEHVKMEEKEQKEHQTKKQRASPCLFQVDSALCHILISAISTSLILFPFFMD